MHDLTAFMYREACMAGAKEAETKFEKSRAKMKFSSERCGVRINLF